VGGLSGTVCAYWPVGAEPGSVLMLDALLAAGCRVLLPVVVPGAGPLDWAEYAPGSATLAAGPYGLLEPVGQRLGVAAVASAETVLVPALAVDRRGVRLGRGGGYYDRSLLLAAPEAALVAVVRDSEVVAELPAEPHDVPMTAALTPSSGFTPLGRRIP
jgi:5-formyltetrahydrofolate cyclo-ligase